MGTVVFRVAGTNVQLAATQAKLPTSRIDGSSVVLISPLNAVATLNEHLVWLWGMLKHERRILKSLAAGGATLTFECRGFGGPISVLPNGAEAMHLLGAELLVY
jgi:hypothetical protein